MKLSVRAKEQEEPVDKQGQVLKVRHIYAVLG